MKITEKKDKTITLRISSADLRLFQAAAKLIGQTPSKLLSMFVDSTIVQLKIKLKKGEIKDEDIKALCDNQL